MSQWQPTSDKECFYFFADAKPDETVDLAQPDTNFCIGFFSTSSSFKGAKNADLPWLKQYKESESLEESIHIVKKLFRVILDGNFQDPYIWVMSSKYSTIDRNGTNFLRAVEAEVPSVRIEGDYIFHGSERFSMNKAKMLVWYNFCLCMIAPRLVDEVNKWGLPRGSILIDRLGDSDKRIMSFMQMITKETSLSSLWKRHAEDHEKKPEWIGYEYATTLDDKGKAVPPLAVVDWLVHAAYAVYNGRQNRDPKFQAELEHLSRTLEHLGICKPILYKGNITWT